MFAHHQDEALDLRRMETMSSSGHARDRDIQRAKQLVEEAPEIREERVAAAKRALRTGTLNLEGTELAEKMLSESLHKSSKQA
jgi:anti-sigma28 factor (negative regulator of flagellin synthesis)